MTASASPATKDMNLKAIVSAFYRLLRLLPRLIPAAKHGRKMFASIALRTGFSGKKAIAFLFQDYARPHKGSLVPAASKDIL
jgi:hypothetical protein